MACGIRSCGQAEGVVLLGYCAVKHHEQAVTRPQQQHCRRLTVVSALKSGVWLYVCVCRNRAASGGEPSSAEWRPRGASCAVLCW